MVKCFWFGFFAIIIAGLFPNVKTWMVSYKNVKPSFRLHGQPFSSKSCASCRDSRCGKLSCFGELMANTARKLTRSVVPNFTRLLNKRIDIPPQVSNQLIDLKADLHGRKTAEENIFMDGGEIIGNAGFIQEAGDQDSVANSLNHEYDTPSSQMSQPLNVQPSIYVPGFHEIESAIPDIIVDSAQSNEELERILSNSMNSAVPQSTSWHNNQPLRLNKKILIRGALALLGGAILWCLATPSKRFPKAKTIGNLESNEIHQVYNQSKIDVPGATMRTSSVAEADKQIANEQLFVPNNQRKRKRKPKPSKTVSKPIVETKHINQAKEDVKVLDEQAGNTLDDNAPQSSITPKLSHSSKLESAPSLTNQRNAKKRFIRTTPRKGNTRPQQLLGSLADAKDILLGITPSVMSSSIDEMRHDVKDREMKSLLNTEPIPSSTEFCSGNSLKSAVFDDSIEFYKACENEMTKKIIFENCNATNNEIDHLLANVKGKISQMSDAR